MCDFCILVLIHLIQLYVNSVDVIQWETITTIDTTKIRTKTCKVIRKTLNTSNRTNQYLLYWDRDEMWNVIVSALIAKAADTFLLFRSLTHSAISVCVCMWVCQNAAKDTYNKFLASLSISTHDTFVSVYVWYHLMWTITHSVIREWNASACYNLRTISIHVKAASQKHCFHTSTFHYFGFTLIFAKMLPFNIIC